MGQPRSAVFALALAPAGAPWAAAACGARTLIDVDETVPAVDATREATVVARDAGRDAADARADVVTKPKPPLPDSATSLDLGLRSSGEFVRFNVPAGTLGFSVAIEGPDDQSLVRLERLLSPSGDVLFSAGVPRGTDLATGEGLGFASGAVPQSDLYRASAVEPGSWTLMPFGEQPGKTLRVTVTFQRTSDGFFHGGELDLHVYIAKGLTLSLPGPLHEVLVQNAATDAALSARIDAFYELLEAVTGIGRGRVFFHGVPARFVDLTDDQVFSDALRETRVAPAGQALHVLFVNDIFEGQALGVAPAVPGFANHPGTAYSGLAVQQYEASEPEVDAFTMLHEMGHFVGLSHTTELNLEGDAGIHYDPLPDTPRCDGGVTLANVGRCPDFSNIMFPTGDQGTGELSVGQVRVIRGASVYRAAANGAIVPPPRTPLPQKFVEAGRLVMRRCATLRRR